MWQIFTGSLLLSIIHALIPNHWLPLIAIGKSENWTIKQTLSATAIAGFSHILSTIFIGIIVGFIGFQLSSSFEFISPYIAPLILVLLGIIYLFFDWRQSYHHNHTHFNQRNFKNKSRWTIIISLSIAMFLSPCAELEIYFFQAGTLGWIGIVIVSTVYTICTVSFMLLLVYLGIKGVSKMKWTFLEHHNKLVTGLVLIVLGILAFIVHF